MNALLIVLSLMFSPAPEPLPHPAIASFQALNPCGGGFCDAARNLSHRNFPTIGGDQPTQPEPVKNGGRAGRTGGLLSKPRTVALSSLGGAVIVYPNVIRWLASFLGGPDQKTCQPPQPVVTCESQLADCREELGRAKICFTAYKTCLKKQLGAR